MGKVTEQLAKKCEICKIRFYGRGRALYCRDCMLDRQDEFKREGQRRKRAVARKLRENK